ncbi:MULTISPECIES: hypothetical protein [unclassified Rhodosalinus]
MHLHSIDTRGLGLLLRLSWDRLLFPAAILLGLMLGAFLATL